MLTTTPSDGDSAGLDAPAGTSSLEEVDDAETLRPTAPSHPPLCGEVLPPLPVVDPSVPPPPDACRFSGASPSCPQAPTEVVRDGTAQAADPRLSVPDDAVLGGFARWGGQQGGAICVTQYEDGSVVLTNGPQVLLIRPDVRPIVFGERTDLARSSGVWGVVSSQVLKVRVTDSSRAAGVLVPTRSVDSSSGTGTQDASRFFVAPVGSGPFSVAALDATGGELAGFGSE